jgi:hypothetical protein
LVHGLLYRLIHRSVISRTWDFFPNASTLTLDISMLDISMLDISMLDISMLDIAGY